MRSCKDIKFPAHICSEGPDLGERRGAPGYILPYGCTFLCRIFVPFPGYRDRPSGCQRCSVQPICAWGNMEIPHPQCMYILNIISIYLSIYLWSPPAPSHCAGSLRSPPAVGKGIEDSPSVLPQRSRRAAVIPNRPARSLRSGSGVAFSRCLSGSQGALEANPPSHRYPFPWNGSLSLQRGEQDSWSKADCCPLEM
uniref:Uncharacterized protein n=1 Tax=Xenopus tropicalis TaxID=8364 RepID=A0A1B8Y5M3_XENTR